MQPECAFSDVLGIGDMGHHPKVDFSAVRHIYDAMQAETLKGIPLSDIVGGGGDPLQIAESFIGLLISEGGLKASSHVLDLGCGCGRLAAALMLHLGPAGDYIGIDIVPGLVEFATRHISSERKEFRFFTIGQRNSQYDYFIESAPTIERLDEVCERESIDLCVATSLFTHLNATETTDYLRSIERALKPDGAALITLFLIDPIAREIIKRRGKSLFQFAHGLEPGLYIEKAEEPRYAVAFEFDCAAAALAASGLYIDRCFYGSWSGRYPAVSVQDILVVRKMPGLIPKSAQAAK